MNIRAENSQLQFKKEKEKNTSRKISFIEDSTSNQIAKPFHSKSRRTTQRGQEIIVQDFNDTEL